MWFAVKCILSIELLVFAVIAWRCWVTRNRWVQPEGEWLCARCNRRSEDCYDEGCIFGPCPMVFHHAE